MNILSWLPTSRDEINIRGWEQLDIILFTGDAYVDHPAFGAAVIGRVLEAEGFRVAIVPQPNWRDDLRDFKKMGEPRLFFGVTSGCMDSMVNHYTANKRLRSDDAYTAGNVAGFRPNDAVIVYTKILKNIFPNTPVIIGGIEASLRRLTHYDYWRDTLKPGILFDSAADMLIYGMGEKTVKMVAKQLNEGKKINELTDIPQTVRIIEHFDASNINKNDTLLNSFEDCVNDKRKFAENFCIIETESNKMHAAKLIEPAFGKYIVVNPPEYCIDAVETEIELPYTRLPHPRYKQKHIPAYEMIKFSVNIHRGCFGGCSFCTISAHQGKFIVNRSEKSILNEVKQITQMPDFKGYLTDLGGASANMYGMKGRDTKQCRKCSRHSCIFPKLCKNLNNSHRALLALYEKVCNVSGIKKVFIGSGIRYDLFMDANGFYSAEHERYFVQLLKNHVSGRLKVAPEHSASHVLKAMRKPDFDVFLKLKEEFDRKNTKLQLLPYLMSSHPGCNEVDMYQLTALLRKKRILQPEQVQDFTPTPMTLSSVMFYCGFDPYTGDKIYVARKKEEKLRQKNILTKNPIR